MACNPYFDILFEPVKIGPGTIASAVYSGHKFAREFDEPDPGDVPFKREINVLGL